MGWRENRSASYPHRLRSVIAQITCCQGSAIPEVIYRCGPHCGGSSKRPGTQGDRLMVHESPFPAGSERPEADASWPGADSSYAPAGATGYGPGGPAGYGSGGPAGYGSGPAGYGPGGPAGYGSGPAGYGPGGPAGHGPGSPEGYGPAGYGSGGGGERPARRFR